MNRVVFFSALFLVSYIIHVPPSRLGHCKMPIGLNPLRACC